MTNSLRLVGDGDEMDLVEEIETSFNVKFPAEEILQWFTVGDIFASLQQKFPDEALQSRKCATTMAFFRLRKTLLPIADIKRLKPQTLFEDISSLPPRLIMRHLETHSTLRMPIWSPGLVGSIGFPLLLFSVLTTILSLIAGHSLATLISFIAACVGITFMIIDRGRPPNGCKTLGDLARRVAGLNHNQLRGEGAGQRSGDLWDALLEALMEYGYIPKADIKPDTILVGRAPKAA